VLLGAHVPTTGGLACAPANGRAIGATAIQIFTRNKMQWAATPVEPQEAAAFKQALAASGVQAVVVHGSYLVNLASPIPEQLRRSRVAFVAELERCRALGIPHLIFHPGAHMGAGEARGLATIAKSLDHALRRLKDRSVMPLLEVTAGQGSCLGHRFEHLAAVFERLQQPERVGVCLDTCHLLAAGYDIATPKGYAETLDSLDRLVGLSRVKAIHLNDAMLGLGSRRDRHAPIGKGTLGLETFRRLLNDRRLEGMPMVLETPGPLAIWKREIATLRKLRK